MTTYTDKNITRPSFTEREGSNLSLTERSLTTVNFSDVSPTQLSNTQIVQDGQQTVLGSLSKYDEGIYNFGTYGGYDNNIYTGA